MDKLETRWIRSVLGVFWKDVRSELRTRYALNALVMFVITTLSIVLFSMAGESVGIDVLAGILWVVIFFSAMSGLSRTFVNEEERGTVMTLRLLTTPSAVFFGKLFVNLVLVLFLNVLIVVLYLLLINGFVVQSYDVFVLTLILGSFGLASAATIIAAIVAKAHTKGTLYPVLSFPILLPLLMTVMNGTKLATAGTSIAEAGGEFRILISYAVVVTAASYLLFDFVWKD
ncbi:MAG: heme exporter protein CcmB [Bacteroidota bacterium]